MRYLTSAVQSHWDTQHSDARFEVVSHNPEGLRLDPESKLRVCLDLLAHEVAANFAVLGSRDRLSPTVFAVVCVDPCLEVLTERAVLDGRILAFVIRHLMRRRWFATGPQSDEI